MKESDFSHLGGGKSPTVTECQKEKIITAILKSISVTPYHDGLEKKACEAVSYINNFNDGEVIDELRHNETGAIYRLVQP